VHVLLKARVPDGILYFCECQRIMGLLKPPYSEESMTLVIQGHRLHVFTELEIGDAWRVGSTTQIRNQIDPLKKP